MRFYEPKISPFKKMHITMDEKRVYEYFVHILTFCDDARCVAGEYSFDTSTVNTESKLKINISISLDETIPRLVAVKPVGHTIALGKIEHDTPFIFDVKLAHPFMEEATSDGVVPKGAPPTTTTLPPPPPPPGSDDATEIDKPIGGDSVGALWKSNFREDLSYD